MMMMMMLLMMMMRTTTKVPSLFRPSPLLRALLYEASCNCWKVEHLIIVININIAIIVINITIVIIVMIIVTIVIIVIFARYLGENRRRSDPLRFCFKVLLSYIQFKLCSQIIV